MTKRCTRCQTPKPEDEFHWQDKAKSYRKSECKRCTSTLGWLNRLARCGVSAFVIEQLYQKQNGLCAICGNPERGKKRNLAVDHDHETGKVRGLLCHRCNTFLGLAEDDMERLKRAAEYLAQ